MITLVLLILNGSSLFIADKKDNHKGLNEFEFRQDPIIFYGVSSPRSS